MAALMDLVAGETRDILLAITVEDRQLVIRGRQAEEADSGPRSSPMIPAAFNYQRASSVEDASRLLNQAGDVKVLAV